jgi:hypothetical protein
VGEHQEVRYPSNPNSSREGTFLGRFPGGRAHGGGFDAPRGNVHDIPAAETPAIEPDHEMIDTVLFHHQAFTLWAFHSSSPQFARLKLF